jgi:DNA processing protein
MLRPELAAWLRLLLTPGVGLESARKLLAAFGLPEAIFAQPVSAWQTAVAPGRPARSRRYPKTSMPRWTACWPGWPKKATTAMS